MNRHILLDVAARRLVGGQRLLGGGHVLAGGFELRVERFQPLGLVGQPPFGVVCGGVDFLQRNQPFEIIVHVVIRAQKKPRRLRTGAWRAMDSPRVFLSSICIQRSAICNIPREKVWAHQDSNLERAGYEPAALTVELWARPRV